MGSLYPWPSAMNVANFVTVKPCIEGEERSNFKIWKEQMLCLLESQDLLGFVNGELSPPDKNAQHQYYNQWRRTDRLVKGWILGSVGKDVLDAVWEKQTARDVWVELDNNIFREKEDDDQNQNSSGEFNRYLPLYQAALRGDWDFARKFFPDVQELCTTIITSDSETALHIAVMTGKANDLVKKLVELAPSDELARKDCNGDTALHNAAVVGNTEAATALVDKNPNLLYILNNENRLPLQRAVISCQKKTVTYLISKYDPNADPEHNPFQGQLGIRLLIGLISSEFVDVALDLALRYPDLALLDNGNGISALSITAQTNTLFTSTERFIWWQKLLYHSPADRLNLVPGAALQMQRELQWFKEMEKYVNPSRRTWPNRNKQTPQMIFTKEHANLKADGERWMKDTANACTISAALIATVMFAAAFTIPGGLHETGKPLFSTRATFKLFAISDAISLFTSITSLLMFLSILTSRYAEEDFLYVLPKRLSIGLFSLFVSISFMMLAFSTTLYLVLQTDAVWFLVLLVALGFLPATSFVLLQGPLLFDVLRSTYGPGIFGKKSRLFLY